MLKQLAPLTPLQLVYKTQLQDNQSVLWLKILMVICVLGAVQHRQHALQERVL